MMRPASQQVKLIEEEEESMAREARMVEVKIEMMLLKRLSPQASFQS